MLALVAMGLLLDAEITKVWPPPLRSAPVD